MPTQPHQQITHQDNEPRATAKQSWPEGFFEQTYGSFKDEPLERLPQGDADKLDDLE